MTISPPPIVDELVDDNKKAKMSWSLFFNAMYNGDSGEAWTPTFVSLTEVGTPIITGRYYQISNYLTLFNITITPSTSTSATAGTTYMDNFPLNFTGDGIVFAVSGGLGSGSGHIISSTNRVYVPAWSGVTVPLTLIGICEAN